MGSVNIRMSIKFEHRGAFMEDKTEEKTSPVDTIVAILIAVVVTVGAIVAWRASLADDAAGDADYGGLRAAVNAEETRAINYVNAYESYGIYVNYWRNSRLAQLLETDLETATDEDAVLLYDQVSVANDLADANRTLLETRFLNRDGSYSVQRQMGEMWADAAKEKDLEYEAQFKEADALRDKTKKLLIAFMVLTIAPVFFSLVESVSGRVKYLMVALGALFMVIGTVAAVLIDLGKM